ncbi:MAG: condensation domain-containing protein, partial [Anaerolineae bacterium]|nr:condensation domain-containing protein [Anaerolineae bacterium]
RQTLRDFLRQRLPDYMVPAAIVPLDALPLTPNGKVDRRRLATWDIAAVEAEAEHVPPRTPTEEVLAALWADLLAAPRVGATDNFFALGGHSLLATQLVSRIRDAFGVELPLRALFEAPTLADLARAVDEARQARRGFAAPPLTPMPRDPANEGLPAVRPPLSFAQQRLWFLDQLEPDSPLYNLPAAVRLTGRLDVTALRRALVALVQRHEALRTTFADPDGEAYQAIAPASAAEMLVTLPVDDLSALPEATREAEARRLAVEEARRPFNLTTGPLLRCRLLRLGDQEHVVLLTMHHIVGDGWSVGVLIRELAALYAAFAEGTAPALPDLPVQYADFAYWQRGWLQGETLDAQLAYWRQQLAGLPPLLELPTDRPRPPIPSYRGDTVEITLPPELAAALKALSRREGATLFMTLLAAFQALLHRYSSQDDIAVGTPIAGRTQRETEGLIGFFVNTLVLRGRLGDNPTFRELLRRTRETALEAYAHQDLPFETLVDALAPVRDMSYSPLFQVLFTMQNQPIAGMGLPGLRLEPILADAGVSKFDLTLSVVEDAAGGLGLALEYATDLFNRDTIERVAGHLRTLLEAIAADPDRRIGDLPLLTPAEAQQILVDWTATDAPFPADKTVVDLFEEWVDREPDTVAVVMVGRRETKERRKPGELEERGEPDQLRVSEFPRVPLSSSEDTTELEEMERLTYAELDARANQLAHHLRGLGVGPETIVGLMVERSPE